MVLGATGPSVSQYGFPTCVFKIEITFPMDMIHLVKQCYSVPNHCHVCAQHVCACWRGYLNHQYPLGRCLAKSTEQHVVLRPRS